MSEKRKDSRGRLLRKGESQRKDGTYQYRFTRGGKRQVIYANDLPELREKTERIETLLKKGLDYSFINTTVAELFERHLEVKQNLSYGTKRIYNIILNILREDDFGQIPVMDLKITEAKKWLIKLRNGGKSYSYVELIKSVMRATFQCAYEEDIILKNPFNFRLDFIEKDSNDRIALTQSQQDGFLEYVKNDYYYSSYYDHFNILLGTGM